MCREGKQMEKQCLLKTVVPTRPYKILSKILIQTSQHFFSQNYWEEI